MHTRSYSDDGLSFAYDCSLCGTVLGAVHHPISPNCSYIAAKWYDRCCCMGIERSDKAF